MKTISKVNIPSIRSLLVITDLSDSGNKAIALAFSILPSGGTIYLLHVMKEPPLPNPMYANYSRDKFLTPDEKAKKMEQIRQSLQNLIPEETAKAPVATRIEIIKTTRQSEIADEILGAAEKWGADGVCLTLRDRGPLGSLFSSSVAQAIIKKSYLPLFIVRTER